MKKWTGFNPEQFEIIQASLGAKNLIANIANSILQDYVVIHKSEIEEMPKIFINYSGPMKSSFWGLNGPDSEVYGHTHVARLFDIQPTKNECEHEPCRTIHGLPAMINQGKENEFVLCYKCGARLKPKWVASDV